MDLESLTAMRSSSEFRLFSLSLLRPKILSIDIEIKDIKNITGLKSLMTNSRSQDAGRAIFSGFFAAKVLGVFSAKIRITIVRMIEAIMTEPSP